MDFYDLYSFCKLKAINLALNPTAESIWLSSCRAYSKQYFTPLHVVVNELDPMFVLDALYQDKYPPSIIEEEMEEVYDILQKIKDPNYSRISAEEMESLVDNVLNKEIARFEKAQKKAPTKQSIQEAIQVAPKPKSGSMDFSSLGSEEER